MLQFKHGESAGLQVWVAVQEDGVSLLDFTSMVSMSVKSCSLRHSGSGSSGSVYCWSHVHERYNGLTHQEIFVIRVMASTVQALRVQKVVYAN